MPRYRNWEEGLDDSIKFLRKEGQYIFSMQGGFEFKTPYQNWPPKRLTEESCLTPTEFYKHNVGKIHGDKYDLSEVVYIKSSDYITVICNRHGPFHVSASNFKQGKGCKECANNSTGDSFRKTAEDFISQAISVHNGKYDYSLVDYKTANKKVVIVCREHGEFKQTPSGHLSGRGCVSCGKVSTGEAFRLRLSEVLSRFASVHGDLYDYSEIKEYKNAFEQLTILCKEHGAFQQNMTSHYHAKAGCPTCAVVYNPARRSGFRRCADIKGGYASLYLIKCWNADEVFYKIGITTHHVSRRFAGSEAMPYNYYVEHLLIGDSDFIYDLETELHREYKQVRYRPQLQFGGMTECFSSVNVDEFKKLLEIIG